MTEEIPQLVLLYDRQLLCTESEIDSEKFGSSAGVYVNTVETIEVWKGLEVWEV